MTVLAAHGTAFRKDYHADARPVNGAEAFNRMYLTCRHAESACLSYENGTYFMCILDRVVERTGDNLVLLFLCQLVKVNGIAGYPYSELGIFFRMSLGV